MIKKRRKKGKTKEKKLLRLTPQEEHDMEVESLPKKEREQKIRDEKSIYRSRRKNGKIIKPGRIHSSAFPKDTTTKMWKKRNKKVKKWDKELDQHIEDGGSIKDAKAKKILENLRTSSSRELNNRFYGDKVREVQKIVVPMGNGEIPTLLDFGITFNEAKFVTEYIKDYDEVKAGYKSKILRKGMKKNEIDELINETLSNPNVATAIKNVVHNQIQRTLVTADRTITQISKMAFSDPIEMFKDDGSNSLKDMYDIPPALRVCISQMEHKTVFSGRGADRRVTGHITKIKLHDSLKALQVLLKDIREKTNKATKQINQFNIYGPSNFNLQDRISELDNKELDILLKLSGNKKEDLAIPEKTSENKDEEASVFDMIKSENKDLYTIDDLKDIEQCNLDK